MNWTARASAIAGVALFCGSVALQISGYNNAQLARGLGILTITLFAFSGIAWCVGWWRQRKSHSTISKESEFVPMPDAARILYEIARQDNELWARAAERMSGPQMARGSREEILNWFATWIRMHTQVYGTRPPSAVRELIKEKHGTFKDGALHFEADGNEYEDLAIRRSELQTLRNTLTQLNVELEE